VVLLSNRFLPGCA